MSAVTDAIARAANELGVPLSLAFAIAKQESGFDPTVVGDHGCSHGLFQLNTCGGEGAGMSLAELNDPYTNARRALSEVAAVMQQHPNYSPGQIAAAAQRPADPAGYASSINSILGGGGDGGGDGGNVVSDILGGVGNLPGVGVVGDVVGGGGVPDPFGVVGDVKDAVENVASAVLNLPDTLRGLALFGLFLTGGVALVVLGAHRAVQNNPVAQGEISSSPAPPAAVPVPSPPSSSSGAAKGAKGGAAAQGAKAGVGAELETAAVAAV